MQHNTNNKYYLSIVNLIKYYADKLKIIDELKHKVVKELKILEKSTDFVLKYKLTKNSEYWSILKEYNDEIIVKFDDFGGYHILTAIDDIILDICQNITKYITYYPNFYEQLLYDYCIYKNIINSIIYTKSLKKSDRKRMRRRQRKNDAALMFASCYFYFVIKAPVIVKILQKGLLKLC